MNVVIASGVSVSSKASSPSHCRHSRCASCDAVSAASCSRAADSTRCSCTLSRRDASAIRALAAFQASSALRADSRRSSVDSSAAAPGCPSKPRAAADSSNDWRAVSIADSALAVCWPRVAAIGDGAADGVGLPINQSIAAAPSKINPQRTPRSSAPPPSRIPATGRTAPATTSAMIGRRLMRPESLSGGSWATVRALS